MPDLFPADRAAYWLEIGFGGGEHLSAQAKANPSVGFIGCEPFINGVARLLTDIDQEDLSNIRLFTDDARLLMDRLDEAVISR
ncbi:MAG: tRNA (guanosine(46)-N7)-methyltransferase TrmB, partial [Pseudomonadota bacterium]|nr:tRNA (guanosine(46)-N7)-methyltransferase TrmB [Pseudomonadota bacterium]